MVLPLYVMLPCCTAVTLSTVLCCQQLPKFVIYAQLCLAFPSLHTCHYCLVAAFALAQQQAQSCSK